MFPQPQNSVQAPLQQQGPAPGSWSTQSLSRSRGGSLTAKLPLRAVNSRISELLQGSAGTRSRNHVQGGGTDRTETKDTGGTRFVLFISQLRGYSNHSCQNQDSQNIQIECFPNASKMQSILNKISITVSFVMYFFLFVVLSGGGAGGDGAAEEKVAVVQTLPSPYSKITAPRKPHRCSSGHASDNRYELECGVRRSFDLPKLFNLLKAYCFDFPFTWDFTLTPNSSVLSGELPPAMGKTALFYHSGGSSGYESMLRDSSENTGSTSSAQDSLSEHSSATTSSRRSSKSSKKSRSSTGQRHFIIFYLP